MRTADPSADGRRSAKIFAIVELLSAGDISFRPLPPGRYLVKNAAECIGTDKLSREKIFRRKVFEWNCGKSGSGKNLRNPNTSERAQKLTA